MDIDLVFKIAATAGIIVAVWNQRLRPARAGGSGHDDDARTG